MATQQEKLLHRIEEMTQEQIMQGTYDFSDCCALVLSVDLVIDRSNVSRMLNKAASRKTTDQAKRTTNFIHFYSSFDKEFSLSIFASYNSKR